MLSAASDGLDAPAFQSSSVSSRRSLDVVSERPMDWTRRRAFAEAENARNLAELLAWARTGGSRSARSHFTVPFFLSFV